MPKDDVLTLEGEVTDLLPNAFFRVRLEGGMSIIAHTSGKIRMHKIRIAAGDRVTVEITPYDLTKGRIMFRHRN